jgi:hypothetical protein
MDVFLVPFDCLHCNTEELHSVTYLGNVILSITCARCGSTIGPPPKTLVREYIRDFEHRAARKPGRIVEEARQHPVTFPVKYLLRGVICKPGELLREWQAVVDRLRAS